jgi:cyclophilin family peptidyl-prolyl cis-trans isomerase
MYHISRIILAGIFFLSLSFPAESQIKKTGTTLDIITNKGTITVLLYDETPGHRDNFLQLVKENFYNNMLYHRVINDFLIQIGDPRSRRTTGTEETYYTPEKQTIPAEIIPDAIHRRGVLNAARMGETVNPYLESSSTHFTIIQGRIQTDSTLNRAEQRKEDYYRAHLQAMYTVELTKANSELSKEEHQDKLQAQVAEKIAVKMAEIGSSLKISEAHRAVYKTVGGAPHLDGTYTVFGEVLEGMDVVDAIAATPVERERPIEEIYIIRMQVRE